MRFFNAIGAAWREASMRQLRAKGYVPKEEVQPQIPTEGDHYVVELRGVRFCNARIYRDGSVIYQRIYNERSGSISDIRFTAPNGDKFDWGYSGYGAHDVKITRADGSKEMASRNTNMDHPYASDDADRLFGEYDQEHAVFTALIKTLPVIRIILPSEDTPKAARKLDWRKIERIQVRTATAG
jgi:hypothetical protein